MCVDVKIGVRDVPREIVFESTQTAEEIAAAVEEAISRGSMLSLQDERGRLIIVPGGQVGYVEIGAPETRRLGFGAV
jgi:hypothetical protein